MATTTAAELSKLLSTAVDSAAAAGADAAEADRAVGALKVMQKLAVTASLLKETEAGKRVNKLSKSGVAAVAGAAAAVVQAWKDCVKREQDSRGGSGAASSGGGIKREGSFASTADTAAAAAAGASGRPPSSGGAGEPSVSQQQQQPASSSQPPADSAAAAAAAAPRRPPSSGNAKRDKARAMVLDGLALCLKEEVEPIGDLGMLAAEVEDALWAANCEGARDATAGYLSKVCGALCLVFVCVSLGGSRPGAGIAAGLEKLANDSRLHATPPGQQTPHSTPAPPQK
jgi:hypothetical protein